MNGHHSRIKQEATLQELAAAVLEGVALPESATWTDEQWNARDAEVAAQRLAAETRQRMELDREVVRDMSEVDGWPRRAVEVALKANEDAAAIVKLRDVDFKDRNVAVISGRPGSGKTVGVAWWALRRRTSTKFVRASTFAAASRYDREEREVWLKAPALVLDDAGAEYSDKKGSLMVDLDELIDTYYGDLRPLLITTNCSVDDFKKRYGERITSRLRECGRWISVEGESLRKKS